MKLNYGKTFLLGFGFFGVAAVWAIYNAFVPVFLSQRFGLEPVIIGFFMTLDNIAALFIQPPVGAWSDRLRTPIGRRMPFILIGAPIGALAFGWIPLASVLPLFVAGTATLMLSMALWRTPVVALMPDITPSPLRSQANGVVNFMGGLGAIVAFLVGASLYEINPAYPFWMGSLLVIAASLLVFAFVREPRVYQEVERPPSLADSLRELWQEQDKSALRLLLAIMFWFIGYSAIEAFFNLYVIHHLDMSEADGARMLGQLSLVFVIFALPAGYIGGRFGRRRTILTGISLMATVILGIYLLPGSVLTTFVTRLPVLGVVPVLGLMLMAAGASWALININSLPMVVDMSTTARAGTFTGLYYLFSTMAAIIGPNVNGFIVQFTGRNYNNVMLVAPMFLGLALLLMLGVRRGEAVADEAALPAGAPAAAVGD
jgi:maltose/moltooligosaccharide transporter